MKTTKFHALKTRIKELAAEGRSLRDSARQTSHTERHDLKVQANDVGDEARHHLLAYALLRGKRLEDCESPNTRNAPSKSYVLSLMEKFYVPIEGRDKDEFMAQAETQLKGWCNACDRRYLGLPVKEAA